MIFVRSAVFQVVFYVTFVLLMIVGLPCLLLPRHGAMWIVRTWARVSVALLAAICGIRIEFRNLHLLPRGASILAVKHQSFLETFALINVLDDFSYIFKKELTALPFFGWYVRGTGQISLDRGKRGGALPRLQKAVAAKLARNCQVVIFPEGTRRPVGLPPLYKSGVAALCATSGVACTPVALNTGLFWPRRGFLRRPGTVVIEFLPPIQTGLDRKAFMAVLIDTIEPASNALIDEALRADPSLRQVIVEREKNPVRA